MPRIAPWILLAAAGAAGAAEEAWLPPPVAEGAAQQLAERLQGTGVGAEPATAVELSRAAIAAMRDEIDRWGVDGVLERAPDLSRLGVPRADSPLLDAMARYQVCNMALFLALEASSAADDAATRRQAAIGLTAVTLAVVRLRQPFHAAGGDDAQIEAFLTSAGMNPVLEKLQADADLRAHVESRCAPVLTPLLAEPMRLFGAVAPHQ